MSKVGGYKWYADQLRTFATSPTLDPAQLTTHLDGRAYRSLRATVPVETMREIGAFFTSSTMRQRVADALTDLSYPGPYLDPTCGAGDLLLAAVESRPASLDGNWSDLFLGWDREPEFTDVTRSRLRLAQRSWHAEHGSVTPRRPPADAPNPNTRWFTRVRVADGLRRLNKLSRGAGFDGTILLNPPFGTTNAPPGCEWGEGKVSRAGLFTESAIRALRPGSSLVGILPDVLRSGSRHQKWRAVVESLLDVERVEVLGQFDSLTDVDVFLLAGRRRRTNNPGTRSATEAAWTTIAPPSPSTVADYFEVRVGSVVDNRDPHAGPMRPFATARALPTSGRIDKLAKKRRFSGTVRRAPLVLVRRTNRPSQGARRALGVLVAGDQDIAVDNHLLVAIPRDGSVETCNRLIDALDTETTDDYLDQRIRCRHLTVDALAGLPFTP